MAGCAKVELIKAAWDAQAEYDLARIATENPRDMTLYRQSVEAGDTFCLAVHFEGKRIGTGLVTWLQEDGLVCVVNALAVTSAEGFDAVPELFELVAEWARQRDAEKVRFWTRRAGLVKKTEALGFTRQYVMEREV